jgi:hypothetical protein
MTVNERLVEAGLIGQWDDACRRRDRDEMIRVLIQTDLPEAAAAETVDAVLAHPEIYLRALTKPGQPTKFCQGLSGHLRPTKQSGQ